MPFDDDKRVLVERFNYKKVYIEISQGLRGGICADCKLDHRPHQASCDVCGKPIKSFPIFFVTMLGAEILELPTRQEAIDQAKAFIDRRLDRLQAELECILNEGDEDDDEDDDESLNQAVQGKQVLSPLEQQIVQLGWVQKANAILDDLYPPK